MESSVLKEQILKELWETPLFDVHSHFCSQGDRVDNLDDYILGWSQPEVEPPTTSEDQKRRWFSSRFRYKRSLWFCRAFSSAIKDLYETKDAEEIARRMNELRQKGLIGSMKWMKEKANVEFLVIDSNPELARKVDWVFSTYRLDFSLLGGEQFNLEEGMRGLEERITELKKEGAISCIKVPIAYDRSLYMEEVSREEAGVISSGDPRKRSEEERKKLENYIYRYLFRKAGSWNMPVEIHTGFGWAIHKRPLRLSEADPENLLPVFEDPDFGSTNFILFHGGYPFLSKTGYLAASFSNVFLDFTCLCPESRNVLIRGLHEWLDIVPMDRIVAGSDGSYEWLYFAARCNREALASVLADKVSGGFMSMDLALEMGRRILRDNAYTLFDLK